MGHLLVAAGVVLKEFKSEITMVDVYVLYCSIKIFLDFLHRTRNIRMVNFVSL